MTFEKHQGTGRTVTIVVAVLALGGVALLWSWNTLATDYFGLPEMEFRHAIAAEVLLLAVGALIGLCGVMRRIAS